MVSRAQAARQPKHVATEKRVSVVIPAYNEEKHIVSTLRDVHEYLTRKKEPFEIIVVDDGSSDGTAFLVRRIATELGCIKLITYSPNRGKGYAVKRGVLSASGKYILISDADLSTPIDESDKLIALCRESADIVFGSRGLADSKIETRQTFSRFLMGRIFNLMVRVIALPGVYDTQCGFKCLKKDAAHSLFDSLVTNRFAFDVELLMRAKREGYVIKEVPIRWRDIQPSTVRPLSDAIEMFIHLLKIRRLLKK
ncbi:MAG: glycosyltransferase family 2 protein [Firmicutes bacterium]|nr:glycosyltransferase family 2 protein [Bacillota bacterium]